ncbi:MAG: DUF4157 domain-containing protein [Thermoanaerobaculia bacterium]
MLAASSLPDEVCERLGPHFPELDLRRVLLCQRLPWHVRSFAVISPAAYTSGFRIYLAPGVLDVFDDEALSLLAHELAHVRQFQQTRFFRSRYAAEYFRLRARGAGKAEAYARISFEVEARRIEETVRRELTAFVGYHPVDRGT